MTLPFRTPFFLPKLYPDLIWRKNQDKKELFLTFDDGPIPEITTWVLQTLNLFQVEATFFVIGDNVRKYPDIFKEVIAKKHSVGNHTFNHIKGWQTKMNLYLENIEQCDEIMAQTSKDFQSNLFRPPYGQITKKQSKALSNKQIIMWDVLTQDYNKNLVAEDCLHKSIKALRSGSIIVMHDSLKAEKNLRYVLPRLLEYALKENYTFKKL